MNLGEFENEVSSALKSLPPIYRDILKKEEIEVMAREKVPPALQEKNRGKIILGVFAGTSRKDKRTRFVYPEPTRIEIYMESFEKAFGSQMSKNIKNRIKGTLIHEIAHYFGFGEDEIRIRGY
ncbi:MAG: metallopeptidase family protein [Elusimicrobiota bacterium]